VKLLGHIPNREHLTTGHSFSGDDTAGETPLPIPNRVDKPRRADGTVLVTVRESRSLPGIN
jgi:hypothetical protein